MTTEMETELDRFLERTEISETPLENHEGSKSVVGVLEKQRFLNSVLDITSAIKLTGFNSNQASAVADQFDELAHLAEKIGAPFLAQFVLRCESLCHFISQGASPELCVEAEELLSTSVLSIRSSVEEMVEKNADDVSVDSFGSLSFLLDEILSIPMPNASPEILPENARPITQEVSREVVGNSNSEAIFESPVKEKEESIFSPETEGLSLEEVVLKPTEAPLGIPTEETDTCYSQIARHSEIPQFKQKNNPSTSGVLSREEKENPSTPLIQKLIDLCFKLTRETHDNHFAELSKQSLQIAEAAKYTHSVKMSEVCHHFKTDTPDAPVPMSLVEWVSQWIDDIKGACNASEAIVSLRQLGSVLKLELRQKKAIEQKIVTDFPTDYLFSQDAFHVLETRTQTDLPVFEAYQAWVGSRCYLIPAIDVLSVEKLNSEKLNFTRLAEILELPNEWVNQKAENLSKIKIRWREKECEITAEKVTGPDLYISRTTESAGHDYQGLVGVSRIQQGARAVVVDISFWLENDFNRKKKGLHELHQALSKAGKYLVFRVAGKRYALPLECIRGVGRLDAESIQVGMVESQAGAFHLRDIRDAMGLEGVCGSAYVAIQNAQGVIAWAVDGIDALHRLVSPEGSELVGEAHLPLVQRFSRGMVSAHFVPLESQSKESIGAVFLVDPNYLTPDRILRRVG